MSDDILTTVTLEKINRMIENCEYECEYGYQCLIEQREKLIAKELQK